MAATGYTPIQLYRTSTSGASPTSGNLTAGELAINYNTADMSVWALNSGGSVIRLMNNPAGLKYPTTDGTVNQVMVTNGSGVLSWAAGPSGTYLPLAGGTMTGLLTTKELALTKTAPSISAGVLTLDCSLSNTFAVSLNAAITSFTVSNIPTSGSYYEFNLEFTADGTARAVTWTFSSVAVKWPGGTAPTLTSTSGKKDTFVFYTYDAGTWLGFVAGQNL
jgi:hypothetical protein